MFSTIYLHDFKTAPAQRAAIRKFCGPYRWRPAQPMTGRGFYMASDGFACASHGAGFDLRLSHANDHLPGCREADGYYCDEDGWGETMQPIVARLPKGRGFLAGWTMGAGMCASIDATIYDCERDAAWAAHSIARNAAEAEIEYQAEERERIEAEELAEQAAIAFAKLAEAQRPDLVPA